MCKARSNVVHTLPKDIGLTYGWVIKNYCQDNQVRGPSSHITSYELIPVQGTFTPSVSVDASIDAWSLPGIHFPASTLASTLALLCVNSTIETCSIHSERQRWRLVWMELYRMLFTSLSFTISVCLFPDRVQTFHISIRKRKQKAPSWGKLISTGFTTLSQSSSFPVVNKSNNTYNM